MDFNKKIKFLWGIPSYRVRLLFFVILGVSAILASLIVQNPFWQDLLANFAVTFAAVGFIDFLWDLLGGEPMEAKMMYSFGEVNQKIDTISQSMSVIADLTNGQIGIQRIWPSRREWEKDPIDGLSIWKTRVCHAKQVDIVSSTFYTRWAHDDEFWNELFDAVNSGTNFRLIIYDPISDILRIRSQNEDETIVDGTSQMKMEIFSTIEKIAKNRSKLDDKAKDKFEFRLNSTYYQLAQIIRADKQLLITTYLSKKSGSSSPTFQVSGPDSTYYNLYTKQFDILWKAGTPLIDEDYMKLHQVA